VVLFGLVGNIVGHIYEVN